MKFTHYTIIGKDCAMIDGHLNNIVNHSGFSDLPCEKEILVIVYKNSQIPASTTDKIIKICNSYGARTHIYEEPTNVFIENLYACWNLGYEKADDGFVFRSGSDQAFNTNGLLNLYHLTLELRKKFGNVLINTNTIEHAVRSMSHGNTSRHIIADLGDSFKSFNIEDFDLFCEDINMDVDKKYLTVDESIAAWGKPTPFRSTLGHINRTEGCSWIMTKQDWIDYGPMVVFDRGITGDCAFHDKLQLAGYKDFLSRDCVTYHFFRGESLERYIR